MRHLLDEQIDHGRFDDDAIPTLFPGCNQAAMPNLFGAPMVETDGERNAIPIVIDAETARSLPAPKLGPEAEHWLTMIRYFREQVGDAVPIRVADMQGPVDAAAQLWSYDGLFLSSYEDPEAYDHLMRRLVEGFLLFWNAQAQLVGEGFVPSHLDVWGWMPLSRAVTLSMDSLVMMSPEFCQERCMPYLKLIADHFPEGMVVHSCGEFRQHRDLLQRTPFIRGVHFGQMCVTDVVDAGFDGSLVLLTGDAYAKRAEVFEHIRERRLRVDLTISGVAPQGDIAAWTDSDWRAAQGRCDEIADMARETAVVLRQPE